MLIFKSIFLLTLFIEIISKELSTANAFDKYEDKIEATIYVRNDSSKATLRIASVKKLQISRVTQKRYGIVNMLWRKTKIFGDVEEATRNTEVIVSKRKREQNQFAPEKLTLSLPYLRRASSTPSYIEFHYLDLSERKQSQTHSSSVTQLSNKEPPMSVLNSPFFLFHVQYETCKTSQTSSVTSSHPYTHFSPKNFILSYLTTTSPVLYEEESDDKTDNVDLETCPFTTLPLTTVNSTTAKSTYYHKQQDNEDAKDGTTIINETTVFDRIKFFEIYDSDTPTPQDVKKVLNKFTLNNDTVSIDNEPKAIFDDNDYMTRSGKNYNKTRFVKKHIDAKQMDADYLEEFSNISKKIHTTTATYITNAIDDTDSLISRPAAWAEFPFVAVYIYDPLQVRCDAASLSPHWLLAAASCLSRRYKDTYHVEAQSAYVAYCTDNWRNPERIAYVKRSFVHPRFDANDHTNRYLYNIGVIQIVNSMAETCNGWTPISLISHQFDAKFYGSMGAAVGWGLDRYDGSRPISTKYSLMLYQNLVYSDFCSTRTVISKLTNARSNINDVYCLSLPNYSDENNDQVHGAMLLIGGKLIALYLQEEPRPSGQQSALYTGVWRHVPWILDTAREPEEFVTFLGF